MDDQSARFIEQLKQNPALLQTLLRSSDGQSLLQMLNDSRHGPQLRNAVRNASHGNPEEAVRLVSQFMQTPDGAALASRIQQLFGEK